MGILNVTPDSFSDGGRWTDPGEAIAHGRALVAQGAAIVDVGGESSRPGARPVAVDDELARVVPVIEALAASTTVPISVDTTKAVVADAALRAGAEIVNDISAATHDPELLDVVAAHDAGVVLMHMQGVPATMQDAPHYDDVVAEVTEYLRARVDAAVAAGVRRNAIIADPGIGFGKTHEHNLALLAALGHLVDVLDVPVLVGTSRKGFLGPLWGGATADRRDDATLATTVWAFAQGVAAVRVHDVESSVHAAHLLGAIADAARQGVFS